MSVGFLAYKCIELCTKTHTRIKTKVNSSEEGLRIREDRKEQSIVAAYLGVGGDEYTLVVTCGYIRECDDYDDQDRIQWMSTEGGMCWL